jgi:hypothetical protein
VLNQSFASCYQGAALGASIFFICCSGPIVRFFNFTIVNPKQIMDASHVRVHIFVILILLGTLLGSCGKKLSMPSLSGPNINWGPETCIKYANTKLRWDQHPNNNGNLDGFKVYRSGSPSSSGADYSVIHSVVHDPLETEIKLSELTTKLDSCSANYLFVRAQNTDNVSSSGSNVVCWGVLCQSTVGLNVSTSSVTLAWDPSPDATVTGYKIYRGTASRVYSNNYNAGNVLTYTVTGHISGVTYYYAATAYEGGGLESDFSNEVSYTVPGEAAPTNLAIAL